MDKVSIILPARKEKYLTATLNDIFAKAEGEIEVIAILDGYWVDTVADNVIYLHNGESEGMRKAINAGVSIATGKYIMKLDAHCMLDQGFDTKLKQHHKPEWIQVPTRKRLNAEKWELVSDGRPDINYLTLDGKNRGRLWNRKGRENILIDDIIAFQGSCYFMERDYFYKLELLDAENFGPMGHESQEICLKCWFSGGRVVRNKHTWYAHWHKEKKDITFKNDRTKSREYLQVFLEGKEEQLRELKLRLHSDEPIQKEEVMSDTRTPKTDLLVQKFGLDRSKNPMQIKGMGRKQMFELFNEMGFNSGAEVGVQRGRNSMVMFNAIPDLHLWCVDPYNNHPFGYRRWEMKHHNKFKEQTVERLQDNKVIDYVFDFSENAVQHIPDESLDFVYIDGDHSYDFVMMDILLWYRKVKPGGVIAGHDYYYDNRRQSNIAKVTAAVNDYTKIHRIPFFITDKTGELPGDKFPSWFWVKENTPRYNKDKDQPVVDIIQYTDNSGDPEFMEACRSQIKRCASENNINEIICVSQKPVENFGRNIVLPLERAVLSIFKQVVAGLEASTAEFVYLCEHDLIYHPSHFKFIPPEDDVFYYDRNRWSVCDETGKAVFYHTDVPSMLCANRKFLLKHYRRCLEDLESKDGKWNGSNGYSPPKGLPKNKRIGKRQTYISDFPSLDVRRKEAWTRKRMDRSQFRNTNSCRGWTESGVVPGWGLIEGQFQDLIERIK